MDQTWKELIWRQFGAAIDTLDQAITACPDALWQRPLYEEQTVDPRFAEFWYIAFHTLFWLDFYLSDTADGFAPPAPFTLAELEPGAFPERVYTQAELRAYLAHGRQKCRAAITESTDLLVPQRSRADWPEMRVAELLLYNMRHVQEHAAQLSLFLGQEVGAGPGWVSGANSGPV